MLFRKSLLAAGSLGLLVGATSSNAQGFDPFADPFAPFAPIVVNVAKEGIVTGNIGEARWPREFLPQISNFEVIGRNIVPNPGDRVARGRMAFSRSPQAGWMKAAARLPMAQRAPTLAAVSAPAPEPAIHRSSLAPSIRTERRPAMPPEIAIIDITDPRNPTWAGAVPTIWDHRLAKAGPSHNGTRCSSSSMRSPLRTCRPERRRAQQHNGL
jgi:hypothetical protein